MWTVIKIDKKKLQLLKEDFKKYLGNSSEFYIPKMVIQNVNLWLFQPGVRLFLTSQSIRWIVEILAML